MDWGLAPSLCIVMVIGSLWLWLFVFSVELLEWEPAFALCVATALCFFLHNCLVCKWPSVIVMVMVILWLWLFVFSVELQEWEPVSVGHGLVFCFYIIVCFADQLLLPLMALCYCNGQGCHMSCIFIINKISTFYLKEKLFQTFSHKILIDV